MISILKLYVIEMSKFFIKMSMFVNIAVHFIKESATEIYIKIYFTSTTKKRDLVYKTIPKLTHPSYFPCLPISRLI